MSNIFWFQHLLFFDMYDNKRKVLSFLDGWLDKEAPTLHFVLWEIVPIFEIL